VDAEVRVVKPHKTFLHYAQILKRNKVLAVARNSIGSRSRGCGYSDATLHAERAVVKKLGDTSKLKGTTLVVWRVNETGDLRPSKPCPGCQLFLEKCMREYGLRKVVY
jgi:cytidine deaminase